MSRMKEKKVPLIRGWELGFLKFKVSSVTNAEAEDFTHFQN